MIKEGLDLLPEQIWSSLQKVKADGKFYCKIAAETKKRKKKINGEILMKIKIQMEWDNVQITCEKYISKYDLRDISVPWLHI